MVRKETVLLILILAALVGLTFALARTKEQAAARSTPTSGVAYVFGPELGSPVSIEIVPVIGESVRVRRGMDQAWSIESPRAAAANQGLAEAAATQVTSLRRITSLTGEASIYGLESPAYLVTVEFSKGARQALEIGSSTPTGSGYYARLNSEQMLIVGRTGLEALLNLVSSPPFLETPTGSPAEAAPAPLTAPTATPAAP
jgi:hypothetical protein